MTKQTVARTPTVDAGSEDINKQKPSILASAIRANRYRYLSSEKGSYHDQMISELRVAIDVVTHDDLTRNRDALNLTKMVRFNRRKQEYELRFGIGKRCVRIDIPELPANEIAVFYDIETLRQALEELLKRAQLGEFDEALEARRLKYLSIAKDMVTGRKKAARKKANDDDTAEADNPSNHGESIHDLEQIGSVSDDVLLDAASDHHDRRPQDAQEYEQMDRAA